jgi:Domain of unknown function (DUF6894)
MNMTRFFFDVVRSTKHTYDFHGRYFKSLTEARELAEYVCLDLACSELDENVGCEIQVRNAAGAELLSIPVRTPDSACA